MSTERDKVLLQRPYAGRRPTEVLPTTDEIEKALHECVAGSLDTKDAGRVLAYAWYHGVENDTVLNAIRKTGAKNILLRELSGHVPQGKKINAELIAYLAHRSHPHSLVQVLGDFELGWALTVISAIEVADFDALIECLGSAEDTMQLVPLYLLVTFVPPSFWLPLTKKFAQLNDSTSQDIFLVLACRWIENAILLDDHPIEVVLAVVESSSPHRVVLIGAIFDYVLRNFGQLKLKDNQQVRLTRIWANINDIGKRIVQDSSDINAVLQQAGPRDMNVLAAMSQWRGDPETPIAAAQYMGKRATELLKRSFKSAMYTVEGEGAGITFSALAINPLIAALKFDGIPVATFRDLHARLASDAFSKMTRFPTWLNDRPRAVALIVIAGMVAKERSDQELLYAVAEASLELLSQPQGSRAILTAEEAKRIGDELGFEIPAA